MMKMFGSAFIVVLVYIGVVDCEKFLPDYIPICKYDDPNLNECYRKSFMITVKHMRDGIPEMNLRKIDPLLVESLSMEYGNGTAVSFGAVISGLNLYGLPDGELVDAKVDLEKLTWTLNLVFKKIRMMGRFKARGRVLLLTFDSDGSFNGNISDVQCQGMWQGHKVKKNGKDYVKFVKADVDLKLKDVKMHFENLFPTREINDRMNDVINENIEVFYDELKPVFINTIKAIVLDSVNNVYNAFPLEELFPK